MSRAAGMASELAAMSENGRLVLIAFAEGKTHAPSPLTNLDRSHTFLHKSNESELVVFITYSTLLLKPTGT